MSTGRAGASSPPVVAIETHGCKLNMADSQAMARRFARAGYAIAQNGQRPDAYILDSCTVTQVADRKARGALASARRRFPGALIVATGCFPARDPEAAAALPAVDLAVPNDRKRDIVSMVSERLGVGPTEDAAGPMSAHAGGLLGRTRAALKIQEGCDQVCAYCIVPRVRGRERSVPDDVLVRQAARLAAEGCREVVLTGTQLGTYGFDLPGTSLTAMLRRVLRETPMERVRVSSLQPPEIASELLELWAGEGSGRLCPHFHIPLQSGSDTVLERMRRRYTAEGFVRSADLVRELAPGAAVTGDVIAGFPGETDADHRASLEVVSAVGFAALHVFPYSPRPGTSAALAPDQVAYRVRAERAAELRAAGRESGRAFRLAAVGSVRPVLWESGALLTGLTDNYLRVWRRGSGMPAENTIERVRLVSLEGEVLVGEAVG